MIDPGSQENSAPRTASGNEAHRQFVTFEVDGRSYGVDIRQVREIRQWTRTTLLPNQPAHTRGVLNLRGTIIPVFDLRVRLGGPALEPTPTNVIVIVQLGDQMIGVVVDAVSDILRVADDEILDIPGGTEGAASEALEGLVTVKDELIGLLDLSLIFGHESATMAAG